MSHDLMRDVLQKIATGPTLSKDLTRKEAFDAMRFILDGKADPVQAGIFFIALRMKRETDEELAGVLAAINHGIDEVPVDIEQLVTLVDPYDGFLRSTPAGPFLAPVLAACGLNVLTHGVLSMGPKFGASHEQVLTAANVQLATDTLTAARQIERPHRGWAYLSQTQLAPELALLSELRTRIVKRPCLTTLEVAVKAFQPKADNHLVTGYVHKPYPPIYARIAREAGFTGCTLIRGTEGGLIPSLTQSARFFQCHDGETLRQIDIDPGQLSITRDERAVPLPNHLNNNDVRSVKAPDNPFAKELATHAAELGINALKGDAGYTRDALIYGGSVILFSLGKSESLNAGAEIITKVLDNGEALSRLSA